MIESYIKRLGTDTLVYWSAPVADASGVMQYSAPKEIKGFYKGGYEVMRHRDGREIGSVAVVYLTEDIDEVGMLWLGELTDLTTAQKEDPRLVAGAHEVKMFIKTPSLAMKNNFARKAIL